MKGKLDEESRCALIKYRLQRAEQTLDEAKVMSDASYYRDCRLILSVVDS